MRRYYLIDHRILFVFGYFFYLFTPYLAGRLDLFHGYPGMELFQNFFKQIPGEKLTAYTIISICWLPAFFLGHFCFKLIRPGKRVLPLFEADSLSRGSSWIGVVLCLVLILFAYQARNSLFAGYSTYDISARGKVSTLLVIFNFFLLYQLLSAQRVSSFIIAGVLITSFMLLTMGGRMYVMQTFLLYLIYKTSFARHRWGLVPIAGFAAIAFFAGSAFGIWRLGASYGLEKAAYSFIAEPVFTWFSTGTFLISNDIPTVNIPMNFLTSFLNLIPNSIVSMQPYIVSIHAMGYSYTSPLGADSVWSTYIINFGSAGSVIFIFFLGFFLNFLRYNSENNRFWAVYYILVCSILPFQFFRDGFYIINKQLFFNFLLFPSLLLLVLRTIIFVQHTRRMSLVPE